VTILGCIPSSVKSSKVIPLLTYQEKQWQTFKHNLNSSKRVPSSGELFTFINNHIKILYYSSGGYCLWDKRLEQGHFHRVKNDDEISLNWTQLQCLIEDINWQPPHKTSAIGGDVCYNKGHKNEHRQSFATA